MLLKKGLLKAYFWNKFGAPYIVRLVLGLSPCDHVSSPPQMLHWLPISYQIRFKIALLMYIGPTG